MDPISAIVSFASLADILCRLYKKLRRYIKSLKVAAAEAGRLANDLLDYTRLLDMVEDTLKSIKGAIQYSARFAKMERRLIAGGRELIARFEELTSGFPELLENGQGNFIREWRMQHRWTAVKEDMQFLYFSVQSSKVSLAIFLGVVNCEFLQDLYQKSLAENKLPEEISKLKEQIARYKRRIRIEEKETQRVQAEFTNYVQKHARMPELSSSAVTKAAQEAAKLAVAEIHSKPSNSSASPAPHFRRSDRSPSLPPSLPPSPPPSPPSPTPSLRSHLFTPPTSHPIERSIPDTPTQLHEHISPGVVEDESELGLPGSEGKTELANMARLCGRYRQEGSRILWGHRYWKRGSECSSLSSWE